MEPKTPEEVYKTWLESAGSALRPSLLTEHPVDSARQNLSATFVNAFVNAGFGRDKLVTTEDGNKWMYKNKDHGKYKHDIFSGNKPSSLAKAIGKLFRRSHYLLLRSTYY